MVPIYSWDDEIYYYSYCTVRVSSGVRVQNTSWNTFPLTCILISYWRLHFDPPSNFFVSYLSIKTLYTFFSGTTKKRGHMSRPPPPDMLHPIWFSFFVLFFGTSFDLNSEFHVKFKVANFARAEQNTHHKSNSISVPKTETDESEMTRPGQRWFEVDDHGRTRNGRSVVSGIRPS